MWDKQLFKSVTGRLLFLLASIAFTRFSGGLWLAVMTLMGVAWAISGKAGKALSMYFMIIGMVELNPFILPGGALYGLCVRIGPLLVGLALMLKGMSISGQSRVPLGGLIGFLLVATISSMNGWAPVVSYLKIINFAVFILGLWFGAQTLSLDARGVIDLRITFLAYSVFLLFGSAILLPFPGISTLSGFQLAMREGNVAAADAAMKTMEGSMPLFCGVTNQSQTFAVRAGVVIAWLLSDMLFVEQKFTKLHLLMLGVGVLLTYYSRSRIGLFIIMVAVVVVAMYLPMKIRLVPAIRQKLKAGVSAILVLGLIAVVVSEISNDTISQWLRKTDDVKDDTRSLTEAVTSSRQGLIEESMRDFWRNPMFGSGFQVAEYTAEQVARANSALIISAPIEKGVMPVMVLGETGIVGAIVFVIFLISFYSASSRRRLYVTASLFTVILAVNMGEASFFSPGGSGGVIWAISIIGGYCIDMTLAQSRRQYENLPYYRYP